MDTKDIVGATIKGLRGSAYDSGGMAVSQVEGNNLSLVDVALSSGGEEYEVFRIAVVKHGRLKNLE